MEIYAYERYINATGCINTILSVFPVIWLSETPSKMK
jgi:hypothetical protein